LDTKPELPLERYFKVLEAIAVSSHSLGLSDIAYQCDLPVATAHRLLQNLQTAKLIVASGTNRRGYQLGQRLFRLLHTGSEAASLAISVQPILDKLANELGHTCYLAKLRGHEVASVAWAVPDDGLRAHVIPGIIMPPHIAASAKAILAFQSSELIDEALAGPLPRLAPETKTTRKGIEKDYAAVRKNGFASCWNEMLLGMGAIAVPIPLRNVGVIYSLGAAGLADRLTRRSLPELLKKLTAVIAPLSKALRGPEANSRKKPQKPKINRAPSR